MEEKLQRIEQLIALKRSTDAELESLIGGAVYEKKKNKCGTCGEEGHSARKCPQKAATI